MPTNPWDKIVPPSKDLSALRIDYKHPLNLFWARDYMGKYLFIYDFSERDRTDYGKLPNLVGINSNFIIPNNPDEKYVPKIIFISSVSAVASSPERPEYCISKAGLSMASQLYADRLASEGIAVYEIRPGVVHTDMTKGVQDKYDRKIAEGLVPQGRWGEPEDIARGVLSLAEGGIPYSTGTIIEMSGGMNIRHL